jgi:outer membrane protein assembly factor BamB
MGSNRGEGKGVMSSAENEDEAWTTVLGKRVLFPPVVAEGRAYLVAEDNTLYAVDLPRTRRGQRRVVW